MNLESAIQKHYGQRDSLSPATRNQEFRRLLQRFADLCRTVEYAHERGVLHRDIKPLNIMLGDHGETILVDWGIAKFLPGAQKTGDDPHVFLHPPGDVEFATTKAGFTVGTLEFSCPEQAAGRIDLLTPRSDVYSLGATLFCVLTGARGPFDRFEDLNGRPQSEAVKIAVERICRGERRKPRDLQPRLSPTLQEICEKAMALEAGDRYPSAEELAKAVEGWLADQPVSAHLHEIQELRSLLEREQGRIEYIEALGRAQSELGLLYDGMGRPEEAEEAFGQALGAYRYVVGQQPRKTSLRIDFISCMTNLARLLESLGRTEEAEDLKRKCREDLEDIIRLRPQDPGLRDLMSTRISLQKDVRQKEEAESFALAITPPGERQPRDPEGTGWPIGGEFRPERFSGPMVFADLQVHGEGGMSTIYRAKDVQLGRRVILKVSRYDGPEILARHVREAQVTSQLDHPSIVKIYGLFHDTRRNAIVIAMALCMGRGLDEEIRLHHEEGALQENLRKLLKVFLAACRGIHYANDRGVIHRDPKPSNIIIGPDGQATIIDWGICKVLDGSRETFEKPSFPPGLSINDPATVSTIGTPSYMAPEVVTSPNAIDVRADVYTLGATLFQMLTNRIPFDGIREFNRLIEAKTRDEPPPPRSIIPVIDRRIDAICRKALRLKPDDRYPTVGDLADDIEAWLEDRPVLAYRGGFLGSLWLAMKRVRSSLRFTSPRP